MSFSLPNNECLRQTDDEFVSKLRCICNGFGKITFTPLTEKAVKIPCHHFLICKDSDTISFIDIEFGLVWWRPFEDFSISIHEGVLNLAKMIIDNAEANVKHMGQEAYNFLYKNSHNEFLVKFYDKMKQEFDPKNLKKDISRSDLCLNNNFNSKIRYSYRCAS